MKNINGKLKKNYKKKLIPVTIVLSVGALSFFSSGKKIAYSEPVDDSVTHIFTFGMAPERYSYSEFLFVEHNYPQWIISDPLAYFGERVIDKGYAAEKIDLYLDGESTLDEVRYLKYYIRENGLTVSHTIVLVSSEYHLGRIKLLCSRLELDEKVNINYVAIPEEYRDNKQPLNYFSQWWRFSNLRKEAFNYMMTKFLYWR